VRGEEGADGGGALEDVDDAGWEAGLRMVSEVVLSTIGLVSMSSVDGGSILL
jgi:hypothetical protein